MNTSEARTLIAPFYDALNLPASKDVRALVEGLASPTWRSFSGDTASKGREEFIQQVIGFGKLIPDLRWEIKEVFADGDRIIVRSEASGAPASDFMGVPHGGKRFAVMTIDIHTVEGGQLACAHHVEDWAGALRQLKG
ncbi:MAG: ester cyclase [Proteobacteria bacterium]|nr:ester cyclase [Pseudomonadota bacterium]